MRPPPYLQDWVWNFDQNFNDWLYELDLDGWYATSGIIAGDVYRITLNEKTALYTIQAADIVNIDTFGEALVLFLSNRFSDILYIDYADIANILYITGGVTSIDKSIFYKPGAAEAALTKKPGFKTGAWHPLCLFYYDKAMRRCDAQTSKENVDGAGYTINGTSVYVPSLNEYSPAPTTDYKWNVNWEINHLPPSYAKWWRWGYAGNGLCEYFVQYIVSSIEDETSWTKLDIAPLQTLKTTTEAGWNQFPQSIIDPYTWQHGDRVRIITEDIDGTDMGDVIDGVYDYEIVKYDETTTPGEYWIYVQDFPYVAIGAGIDTLIEIYRPLKTDTSQVFYEFGELMPIIEDSAGTLVHGVGGTGTQNQDNVTGDPATGTFTAGDVYHMLRTPSRPISTINGYFHESMWYSDFYASDDYDKGRIGFETTFGERSLNIIRYSNQYLQNTGINGLSTFEGDHYKELTDIYGDITSTVEVGTTLKVYMEKKSASILIGRQEYQDTEGNMTVVTSNVVLGFIRYPDNNFGTQWIESVSKNNRYVYGFDVFNAIMWRDSANGIFPISGRYEDASGGRGDYKMQSWFKDKADAIMLSGIDNVSVMTVWDERYKNLYVIFKDNADNTNNEIIVYHEPSNRWICFADLEQTPASYNVMLELDYEIVKGFENGIGYSFDEDTRFAVFDIPTTRADVTAFVGINNLTFEALPVTVEAIRLLLTEDGDPILTDGDDFIYV